MGTEADHTLVLDGHPDTGRLTTRLLDHYAAAMSMPRLKRGQKTPVLAGRGEFAQAVADRQS